MRDFDQGAQMWAEWTHINWFGDACGVSGGKRHAYLFVNAYELRSAGERIADEERVKAFILGQGLQIEGYGIFPIPSDPEADASTFVFAAVSETDLDLDFLRERFQDLMDYHPVKWWEADDEDDGVRLDGEP